MAGAIKCTRNSYWCVQLWECSLDSSGEFQVIPNTTTYLFCDVHVRLQAIDLHKKLFYYLDPYGPSRGVRSAYTALVLVLMNFTTNLLLTVLHFRKYFKMRFQSIGKDKVNIEECCKFVQLNKAIQTRTDGHNCGVYCLKVCAFSSIAVFM